MTVAHNSTCQHRSGKYTLVSPHAFKFEMIPVKSLSGITLWVMMQVYGNLLNEKIFHRGILGWITAPGEFKGDLDQSSPIIESPRPQLPKKSGRISALTSTRWELPSIRWILISKVGVGNVASLEEAAKDLHTHTLRVVPWRKKYEKSLLKGKESVWSWYANICQKNIHLEGNHLRNGGLFKQYVLCPMLCYLYIGNTMSIRITSC